MSTISDWVELGVDQVACGDAGLTDFLLSQAIVVWEMQARRGVVLDLTYQYFVLDLLTLAMDWTRMQIDTETSTQQMTAARTADAQGTADAVSTMARSRVYAMLSDSSGSQTFTRTASRLSNSSATGAGSTSSNTVALAADNYDNSITASKGNLDGVGGTRASHVQGDAATEYHTTTENKGGLGGGLGSEMTHRSQTANQVDIYGGGEFVTHSVSLLGLMALNWQESPVPMTSNHHTSQDSSSWDDGEGKVDNTTQVFGKYGFPLPATYDNTVTDDADVHGERINDSHRKTTASMSGTSSMAGTSTMTSTASNANHRDATSVYHSEMTMTSTSSATASAQRSLVGADSQVTSERTSKDNYAQIFASLMLMWTDTLAQIKVLEARVMMAARYLSDQLAIKTPGSVLVQRSAARTAGRLVQGPYGWGGLSYYYPSSPNSRIIQ